MQMNKIIRTPVGADLSRTSPIYRPCVDVSVSRLFCECSLSALIGINLNREFSQEAGVSVGARADDVGLGGSSWSSVGGGGSMSLQNASQGNRTPPPIKAPTEF